MAEYRFKYVKSGPGDLSGPSMIIQTELALSEIGTTASDGSDAAKNAQATADQALLEAQQAQVTADNAQTSADQAQASADKAQDTADTALTVANEGVEKAEKAQATADANTERIEALEQRADGTDADLEALQKQADSNTARIDALETETESLEEAVKTAQETADTAQSGVNSNGLRIDELENRADATDTAVQNAQTTADEAKAEAGTAQETADSNSDRIDNAEQSIGELWDAIENMPDSCFSEDDSTTDIDQFNGQSVRRYLTQECQTVPEGAVAPYWVWSYVRCDNAKTLMFLRDSEGGVWSREGDYSAGTMESGAESWTVSAPHVDGNAFTLALSVSDGIMSGEVSQGEIDGPYQRSTVGEFSVSLSVPVTGDYEDGDEIVCNGATLATVVNGELEVSDTPTVSGSVCDLTLDSANADGENLVMMFVGEWKSVTGSESSWTSWTAMGGGGGSSVSQAYTTLASDLSSGTAVSTQGVSYTPGSNRLFVYYEGVKLIVGENYEETDSDTVTLLFDAESGSTLEFVRI